MNDEAASRQLAKRGFAGGAGSTSHCLNVVFQDIYAVSRELPDVVHAGWHVVDVAKLGHVLEMPVGPVRTKKDVRNFNTPLQ